MVDPTTISLFNAALDKIEKIARVDGAGGEELALAYVYSGGYFSGEPPQTQIPAIYLKPESAITDWQERVIAFLTAEHAATFRFAEIPKLEKLIMTETDELGCQRLTATRYGITSKVAVLSRLAPATLAAVPSRKSRPKPRKKATKVRRARRTK